MKTIFHLLICATLSSGCLSSFHLPGDHFRTSKQNRIKNQHPINLENDRPIDDVSLVDHGPLPGQLQPLGWKRSFFINFMMTGQTYNNFLLVCSSAGRGERKSLFYEKLTEAGKQGQILKK